MTVVFSFILGLFIGSFLNVVVYRLRRGESFTKGYSKCLFCQHRLFPKDLVPLFSFIALKGKCRYCKHSISNQYWMVELATGLSFVLILFALVPSLDLAGITLQAGLMLIAWWVFVSFLIIIFVYDLRYYLIMDEIVIPAIVFALIVNLILGEHILSLVYGAMIGGGFFLLQFVISKGKWIGGGDIRLGVLMGFILGWPGTLTALFMAYIIGSIFAIFLMLGKKKKWADKLPFGTFLSLATFITLLYGEELVNFYFSLFR